MVDLPVNLPTPVEAVTSSAPMIDPILIAAGFVFLVFIVFGIFYLYENSGMRLLNINDNRLKIRRFGDKQILEHKIIPSANEAYEITTQPIQFITRFGSIVPAYIADRRYGITLNVNYPDRIAEYPTPETLKEGINTIIMRELQTYREKKNSGELMLGVIAGGVLGLMAGFVAAGMV